MPKEIRMPKLSDTMEEGTLLAWRKREGDAIRRGEILADIETDKADMEFESYTEGTVQKLVVSPGTTVPVGALIALIRLPGESAEDVAAPAQSAAMPAAAPGAAPRPAPAPRAPAGPSEPRPAPSAAAAAAPAPRPAAVERAPIAGPPLQPAWWDESRLRATPAARRLAAEKGVDLGELEGSGPHGAILVSDIEAYLRELEAQTTDAEGVRATPVALRMAGELGVDLEQVKGSGPAGRITKSDVSAFVRDSERRRADREQALFRGALQLSQKRRALIRNMVKSKAEAPHFYVEMDVGIARLRELRDRANAAPGSERPRLTYTHLTLAACVKALEKYPEANATYRAGDQQIALFEPINVGLAVDVGDELVAPTVKDCQGKSVFQLADAANRLIQRARMRKLQPEDYADGTFTISNLGMFGVDRFYAIITPPQSSILSVGAIVDRAVVREGRVEIAPMTTLGLSVDHRVLDGVKAAQFLGEIRRLLEHPEELVSEES
jgi:pyruvate dehydrogenase E2 component (dihydrolipoamide acetyltransferase)